MIFYEFKNALMSQVAFSHHQAAMLFPGFDPRNFTRWAAKGYLIRLRNGIYTFPEYLDQEGMHLYFANRIYQPSYISLHNALNHYGLIPEFINDITSVTTLKTATFSNKAGTFTYQSVKPSFFFGYESRKIGALSLLFATPEKALIDLFYLYPEYNNEEDLENLRFDRQMLIGSIKKDILVEYLEKMKNQSLTRRVLLMIKIYEL